MDHPRAPAQALFRSLRPHQWIKNVVVFGGLAFTGRWHAATSGSSDHAWHILLSWRDIGHAFAAFAIFCMLSSAGYLVNDLHDIEADRAHPAKRHRPIASGQVPPTLAWATAIALFLLALGWSVVLSLRPQTETRAFLVTAVCYALLTNAYSFQLKRFVIVDVLCIGLLFVLRAIGGCYVIPEPPSPWIIVCTLFGALFIALCKRRAELVASGEGGQTDTRSVLAKYHTTHGYSAGLLDQMIQMAGSLTIMTYSMYTFVRPREINATQEQVGLMFTIPFVVYGVFRYLYLEHKRAIGQSPELVFGDRAMRINLVLWALVVAFVTQGRS